MTPPEATLDMPWHGALLELNDRLRDVTDLGTMAFISAEVVARSLGATAAGYGTMDPDEDGFVIDRNWSAPGVADIAGAYRMSGFGTYHLDLRRCLDVVIPDVRLDPRTVDTVGALEGAGGRSFVNLPVIENGRMVAVFFVLSTSPRHWDAGELAFIRDAAERTRTSLERRRAEHRLTALNASLERQVQERTADLRLYRNIVESAISPICAFDSDHRLTAFNQAHSDEFFRIFAIRVKIGDVFPDLFPPGQSAVMRAFMNRALSGEAYTVTEEFGDPDLAKPTWEVTYSPLRNGDGRIVGAFHHAKDISERLRVAAELGATQEVLRQSQKMEAVGQLTGGVAHDFNNLLTVIRSSTDLLKRPNLSEERRTRYVAAISDTVDRAAKLTGQLLAFARRQALKPEVFAACDGVRALSDMVGTLTGSRIKVTTDLATPRCYINADPSQFDTALVNLVVNARDAMDGEGRISIAVRPVDEIPAMRAQVSVEGSYVAVSLSDTGSGIPAEAIERIFEPFFTTKVVGKGTGLGLSQVFGFVKQSGGDVMVDSTVGEGTTFTLYLPRVAAPAPIVEEEEDPEALVDGHGTRVLVVEDNADVGTFAVQSLTDLGYAPVLAADGPAALAELAKDPGRFDIVFSDVMMPGMSGVELGEEIRRLYYDLPVVLTSGYSHVLAQNGTYGFELLHKPYSIEQLSKILRKTATWQRRRRLLAK